MADQRNAKAQPGDPHYVNGIIPRPGDVYRVTRMASIQFIRPILFRVIRMQDWATYDGWAWIEGYELNAAGDAVGRRTIFVMPQFLIRGRIGASPPGPARDAGPGPSGRQTR